MVYRVSHLFCSRMFFLQNRHIVFTQHRHALINTNAYQNTVVHKQSFFNYKHLCLFYKNKHWRSKLYLRLVDVGESREWRLELSLLEQERSSSSIRCLLEDWRFVLQVHGIYGKVLELRVARILPAMAKRLFPLSCQPITICPHPFWRHQRINYHPFFQAL